MRKLLLVLSTLALTDATTVPKFAQSNGSSLSLQNPAASPTRTFIDGVSWNCAGQSCIAVGQPRSQASLRACQRVAARLGPVTAFTYAGRALEPERLPACNAQARQSPLVASR